MAKRLLAIDGNSLLYRAYYAIRELSTSDGTPTNAVYGLAAMLQKIMADSPDYALAAFDTPKPTFRHEKYEEYKGHRKPTPDDLIAQGPLARELMRAFGIPVVEIDGYEADDVIGAIAKEAERNDVETTIVTGDQDAFQLVNDKTKVLTTVKGVSETVVYDAEGVREKMGVAPNQVADYKALRGDSSDNIPGVPGIGDKGARELLEKYESIEDLIEHIDELPDGRNKKNLSENTDLAKLSKELATIVCDLPEKLSLGDYEYTGRDLSAMREFYKKMEFRRLLEKLPDEGGDEDNEKREDATAEKVSIADTQVIASKKELDALLEKAESAGGISLYFYFSDDDDTDNTIAGVAISTGVGEAAFVGINDNKAKQNGELDFEEDFHASFDSLQKILEDENVGKRLHDYKSTCALLWKRDINLRGVTFDTMLAAYLLQKSDGDYSIESLAENELQVTLPDSPHTRSGACSQAVWLLSDKYEKRLEEAQMRKLYREIEMPLAPVLAKMELAGIRVDASQLETLSKKIDEEMAKIEKQAYEIAGEEFNLQSTKQLQHILFDKLGLPPTRKTKTGYTTSASALEEIEDSSPIIGQLLRYRELAKIKSTYADSLYKIATKNDGRVHTTLNQTVTSTGRLSSTEPNLQNIPVRSELGRQIRRSFTTKDGYILLAADYSQIDLRVLAHLSGDQTLIDAFNAGEDIHNSTACVIFSCDESGVTPEMRDHAKTINYSVIYGMADFTLGKQLGIPTKEAREYIDTYFDKYPKVREFTESTIEKTKNSGYVTTLFGRRRYFPLITSSNHNERQAAERAAVNMPVQGTAADIIKIAMIDIDKWLDEKRPDAKMLLQVHDDLLFEVHEDEVEGLASVVRKKMENATALDVPVPVDIKTGKNWADMRPME